MGSTARAQQMPARKKGQSPHAAPWQIAGTEAKLAAVHRKVDQALKTLEEQRKSGNLPRGLTYSHVLRLAGIDRKTLFSERHAGLLARVDMFLSKHAPAPQVKASHDTGPTLYERISVNAQEAETVRIRKDGELEALRKQLMLRENELEQLRARRGNKRLDAAKGRVGDAQQIGLR